MVFQLLRTLPKNARKVTRRLSRLGALRFAGTSSGSHQKSAGIGASSPGSLTRISGIDNPWLIDKEDLFLRVVWGKSLDAVGVHYILIICMTLNLNRVNSESVNTLSHRSGVC